MRLFTPNPAMLDWCAQVGIDPSRVAERDFQVVHQADGRWRVYYLEWLGKHVELERRELVTDVEPPPVWIRDPRG